MRTVLHWFLVFVHLFWECNCITDTAEEFVITKLDINTDVRYRFAETLYTITVFNPSDENQTYVADIPFPIEAFVTNVTIEVDGEIFISNVVEKGSGGSNIQNAPENVNMRPTQFMDTSSFTIPIEVLANNVATITLTYQEVLRRQKGVYDIWIIVGHCGNGYNTHVKLSITETKPLTKLKVVPYWERPMQDSNKDLQLVRPSNETAVLAFTTVSSYNKCLRQIKVQYDVERSQNAGEILIEDGYFVHFLAPTGLQAIPKDIIFVLDTSKSMMGEPILELQRSMVNILERLGQQDRFNIIVFQSSFGMFESDLQNVTSENIFNAQHMINFQTPGGGTNIHDGLLAGIKMLHTVNVTEIRSPIIIFLSDGQASSGITNRNLITARVKSRNVLGIPIFSISLGKEADIKLSSKIASQNFGFTSHIHDPSTSSSWISSLYDEVATTLMKHLNIVYLDNAVDNETVTQTKFRTLFNQSEIVTSGKLKNDSTLFLNSRVIGLGASGITVLSKASVSVIDEERNKNTVAAIWRHRRLKEVMRIKDAMDDPRLVAALQDTLLRLSLKYNYITPLTAVVLGRDGNVQSSEIVDNDEKVSYAAALNINDDKAKVNRPNMSRFSGKGDPHFEVTMKGIEYPICFDIKASPGAILRILHISKELVLNIGIIPETIQYRTDKLYISDIFVSVQGHTVLLNVDSGIIYNDKQYEWSDQACSERTMERLTLCANNNSNAIQFELNRKVSLKVKRVLHTWKTYFNFYIENFANLPKYCTGFLGNIVSKELKVKKVFVRNEAVIGNFVSRSRGTAKYHHFTAKLKQKHRSSSNKDMCWHLHKTIGGFIDSPKHYQLTSLFHSDI